MEKFEHSEYKSCIDSYINLFSSTSSLILPSILSGLLVYLLAIIISIIGNFFWLVLYNYQLYIVVLGIIWVTYWSTKLKQDFFTILNSLPISNKRFSQLDHILLDKKIKLTHNPYLHFVVFVLFLVFISMMVLDFNGLINIDGLSSIFGIQWFVGDKLFLKYIVLIFSVIIPMSILLAVSGIYITMLIFNIIPFLLKYTQIMPINSLIIELRPLSKLVLKITYTWFLGVALIIFISFQSFNGAAIFLVSIVTFLGLFNFFFPQIYMRNYIRETKDILIKQSTPSKLYFDSTDQESNCMVKELSDVLSLHNKISSGPNWVLDFSVLVRLILAALAPTFSLLIRYFVNIG